MPPAFDRAKTLLTAEKYVKAGKLVEAVSEYKKLADDNPRDVNVINKLGDLLVRAGRNPEALKYFLRIADHFSKDGFFLKAIAMYKKIAKIDATNIECQQRLADLYKQQGLASEAKAQYLMVADHLVRQNQGPGAADALKKVLEIDPENLKVRITLAEILIRSSKADEAVVEYCQVARIAASQGQQDEVVQVVRKALKANPAHPQMATLLLPVLARLDRLPADFVAVVEEVSRKNSRSPDAVVLLAQVYRQAGRDDEAESALARLQAPGGFEETLGSDALALVGRLHGQRGRGREAMQWIGRAIDRLMEEGRAPEARAILEDFLKGHPEHAPALARLAEVAAAMKDADAEAEALLRLAPALIAGRERERAAEVVKRLAALRPGAAEVVDLQGRLEAPEPAAAPAATPVAASFGMPERAADEAQAAEEVFSIDADDEAGPIVPEAEASESDAELLPVEPAASEATAAESPSIAVSDDEFPSAAAAEPEEAAAPAEEESAYGPVSRIQEIQADDGQGAPVDEEFVSEHLTEAEVFVKYGLLDKAREQLNAVIKRYPRHDAAHVRLKDLFLNEGNTEGAVRECLALADIRQADGRDAEARECVNEAARIDPDSPLLKGRPVDAASGDASRRSKPPAAHEPERKPAAPPHGPAAAPRPEKARPTPAPPAGAAARSAGAAASRAPRPSAAPSPADLEIDLDLPEESAGEDEAAPVTGRPAGAGRGSSPEPPGFASTTARTVLRPSAESVEDDAPDDLASAVGDALGAMGLGDDDLSAPAGGDPGLPPVGGAAPRDPDDEKLGEVDFYIEQGLIDEAREVLFQLRKQHPGSPAVTQRLARLDQGAQGPEDVNETPAESSDVDFEVERALTGKSREAEPKAQKAAPKAQKPAPKTQSAPRAAHARPVFKVEHHKPAGNGEGDFFDLAAELDKTLQEEQAKAEVQVKESLDGQAHSFEDIFEAFKRGVAQQVDSDDFETHYNLGIAYREMGLIDEAIGELQFASRDPSRTLECCGILGLCFRDKGMPDLALKWYKRGLDMPGLGQDQALGLRYDIAELYREKGEVDEALRHYTEVYGLDSTYRDVTARIKEIKQSQGTGRR